MHGIINNPILSGFYPDPSICRVGDDYYMITSSFTYFPGVPVFHSRDLVHWEQIGHVLDRVEQLPIRNIRYISGGIYAPTIRYHDGLFYMITTNVDGIGDFICTAKDPAGPWSDMHILEGSEGIDPSLFWDDNGLCYVCGTQEWQKPYPYIWVQQLDTASFRFVGPRVEIWRGALHDCWAPEAPHIYKKDGWYYLMIAEGGTEDFHAVTIARSPDIAGKYKGYAGNPILTHRHLGWNYPICNVGHADLVQTQDGSWYMVMLASRIYGGYHKNLGRETFITPVDWSGEWPVVNPGVGHVEPTCPAPDLPACIFSEPDHNSWRDLCWNYLGTPTNKPVTIDGDTLRIRCISTRFIPDDDSPESDEQRAQALGFYGRRQQHMDFESQVHAALPEEEGVCCGLTVLQNGFASLRVELSRENGRVMLRVVKTWPEEDRHLSEILYEGEDQSDCTLSICADGQDFSLLCNRRVLAHANGGFMGSETAGGFVGAYIGVYASGNGIERTCEAVFDHFVYLGK